MQAGDAFSKDLFQRLVEEEYDKLLAASSRDVHADSKTTTLPIARVLCEAYVSAEEKLPWSIDLLNINLNNSDLTLARERIAGFITTFRQEGRRITENLDTVAGA